MSQNRPTVKLLEQPAGHGKTTWVRKTVAEAFQSKSKQQFIYVAPTIELLRDFESVLRRDIGANPEQPMFGLFRAIHSGNSGAGTVSAALKSARGDPFTQATCCIGVTHESINSVPTELLADRIVFIDEVPSMLEVHSVDDVTWDILDHLKLISIDDDWVTVSTAGQAFLKSGQGDAVTRSLRETIQKIEYGVRLRNGSILTGFGVEIFHSAAKEVWILGADMEANYLPEYLAMFDLQPEYVGRASDHPHQFTEAEVFYLFDRNELPSRHMLERGKGKAAEYIAGHVKKLKATGGSLADTDKYFWVANVSAGLDGVELKEVFSKHLSEKFYVSPGELGVNKYADCTTAIYLAVTRPAPEEIRAFKEIEMLRNVRTAAARAESRHLHSLYQMVMRSKLRDRTCRTGAGIRILVLTRYEAEWLAAKLGTKQVAIAQPMANQEHAVKKSENVAQNRTSMARGA